MSLSLAFSNVLMTVNADEVQNVSVVENTAQDVIGYDKSGNAVYGGVYDVIAGFSKDGTPIIETSPYNKITGVPASRASNDFKYDSLGFKVIFGSYEEFEGFDEKGNPVVLNVSDDMQIVPVETVGDINGDSKTELTDLTELSLYLIGDKELSDDELLRADVNSDEKVDLADLATLKMNIVNP
jgi:hypothetical protein